MTGGDAEEPLSVSVVMSTYSGERFLREQLRSLVAQTHLPTELVVFDDGSRDGTVRQLQEFAATAPFPVVFRQNPANLGYGESFLRAAALARGDAVAFCDQDDVWAPDKLQVTAAALRSTGAMLVVHRAWTIDEGGRRNGELRQRIHRTGLHDPLSLGPWRVFYGFTMLFRRELLEIVDPDQRGRHTFEDQGLLSHDLWVSFLAESLGTTLLLADRLADYRQHGANATPSVLRGGIRAFTASLGTAARPALRRDLIAGARADLLAELAARSASAVVADTASCASRRWRAVERAEAARLELYAEASVLRRARSWAALVARGAYGCSAAGGLGGRLALKDIAAGVVGARRQRLSSWRRRPSSP